MEIDGPGVVVIAQLAHPDWTGCWTGPEGERPASIVRVFGGWQGVLLPGNGAWTLHLEYRGEDVWTGLKVSAFAWTVGAPCILPAVVARGSVRRRRQRHRPRPWS